MTTPVSCGAANPAIFAAVFVIPIKVPANFGLNSTWFTWKNCKSEYVNFELIEYAILLGTLDSKV